MKKGISLLLAISLVITALLAGCVNNKPAEPTEEPKPTYFQNVTPADGDTVPLIGGKLYYYWRNYTSRGCSDGHTDKTDLYNPKPLEISWTFTEGEAFYYIVAISDNKDMSNAQLYMTPTNSITIPDLFTAHTYYYTITAHCESQELTSGVYSVKTENTVRTIEIVNTSNTRDLGGWATADGTKRIKQGIIYRGGNLDTVPKKNRGILTDYYGVKTEIDCRTGTAQGPYTKLLNYIAVLAPYYIGGSAGINTTKAYKTSLKKEIQTFADPENFPIYFHCQIGRDRTGTLAFFIMAICGVSEQDIYKDYEISHFSNIAGSDATAKTTTTNLYNMIEWLKKYGNANGDLYEGVKEYCHDIGVTDEDMENIRKNVLEDMPKEDYSAKIPLENVLDEKETSDKTFKTSDYKYAEFTVKAGTTPRIELVTIDPNVEKCKIKYTWDDGALDGMNRLTAGDHECHVEMIDKSKTVLGEATLKFHVE